MTADFNVILNFNSAKPVLTGAQFKAGDKGFTINMDVRELDPTGMTPKIAFYRSNGTSVESSAVTNVGNIYSYTLLGNELAVPGVIVADLKFYDGDDQRISSASFIFMAIADTLDGLGGGTESYSDELEQLSAEFQDTLDDYIDAFGNTAPINPRGDYNSGTTYYPRDMVYDPNTGTSWVCKQESTGNAPGSPSNYWQQVLASASASDFGDLADVDFEDLANGQIPVYDGTTHTWKNGNAPAGSFSGLSDVDMAGVQNGQVPTYNSSTQKYEPSTPSGGSSTFAGLSDVSFTTPTNGQVPTYDATEQKWKNVTPISGGILPHLIVTAASGSTVTATLGGTTISLTETSTGKFEGDLTAYGTWTITAITSGATSTESINVDTVKIYSTEIATIPDGSTATPTDNIPLLLHCANIWDKNYTTIAEVIADSETLLAVISSNNAVDYLVRSTTFSSSICSDALAMLYIGQYNYCADELLADNTWLSAICNSEYFELVLNTSVPAMTGYNTPSGNVIYDSEQSGGDTYAWKAFNKQTDNYFRPAGDTSASQYYVGYEFTEQRKIFFVKWFSAWLSSSQPATNLFIQDYENNAWNTIVSNIQVVNSQYKSYIISGGVETSKMRIGGTRVYYNNNYIPWTFAVVNFYGRKDVTPPASRTLKSFATATNEEILEMVCKSARGEIDLEDDAGWVVGQEKSISLDPIGAIYRVWDGSSYADVWKVGETQPAQTVTVVLSNKGGKTLTNSVLNKQGQVRTECSFQWDVKDSLNVLGYMNSTNTTTGSWKECARRSWCNVGFKAALPPAFRAAIRSFKVLTAQTYNGSTNETVDDNCALRAEKEVFGSATKSNATEAAALSQATYYTTAANRLKKQNSTVGRWWFRSPSSSTDFCDVKEDGSAISGSAGNSYGISVFGVIP